MTMMQIPRIISARLVVLRIACSQVYTRHLPAGGGRAKGITVDDLTPLPPPTQPPKKGYHLVNWKKMVVSVERGKSYQEQAVEGGMHHCPAVGSPTRTEKPQNPEIKSSRCCSRDLLENLRGGRGRERGRRRGGIPLPTVEPPSTVELTGVHCGAHPASESLTPARHILHRPIPPASIPHQRSNRFKQPILC